MTLSSSHQKLIICRILWKFEHVRTTLVKV